MERPRKILFPVLAVSFAFAGILPAIEPPKPLPPLPTPAQLAWQNDDLALFLNFGLNTFTGVEQGRGNDDPKLFNPAKLDAQQWVGVAKECGFKRIVLPVKNHDGFCLWPTATTKDSVASSDWKNGKGDVVKEFTDACHAAGIEVGFYLSCEDRNNPAFGTDDYNQVYIAQLTELLSDYGPVSEIRFDGAGGVGGAAMGSVDLPLKPQNYDWTDYFATVRRLQPQAVRVSVIGPDARWNGNNIGHTGDPIWPMFNLSSVPGPEPATVDQLRILNVGDPDGNIWLPAECFVRMRPHWSWRAEDETNLIAPDKLFSAWCKSVGHGCVLLLNVPLNKDGLVPDADAQRLRELHAAIQKMTATDFAAGKPAIASNVRGNDPAFGSDKALDGDPKTYWATDDGVTNATLEVDLGGGKTFNVVRMEEAISLGQRVQKYEVEAFIKGEWKQVSSGTAIGHRKLDRFPPVTASKVRLTILAARACPAISGFGVHLD